MKPKSIHRNDAILLLEDKQPHILKVWKLSTEDIIEYKEATCMAASSVRERIELWFRFRELLESFGILHCLKLMD